MSSFFEPKNLYSMATIFLCAFVFITSAVIILSVNLPIGSDSYFHLSIARDLFQGNWSSAWNTMMQVNHYPYPILYHLAIAPIAGSGDPYTGLRLLEMLVLPITFALTAFVMWKLSGPKAALISGLVLIAGWAFLDGSIQARPESVDLLLYPLILYTLVTVKKKWTGALSLITIYTHGLASVSNIWGFAFKKLREKSWRKTIYLILIIALPILIISILYFGGAWHQWATYQPQENPQEALFWTYPPWIPFYAGLSLMGWFFIFKKPQTEFQSLLHYGLVGNLLMLPFWADRWLQYSAIPLAMLVGLNMAQWHGKKLYGALIVTLIGAAMYLMFFILIAIYHGYWQPGEFIPFR